MENDFVPYTPRGRENLHENLHSLQRGVKVDNMELAIRKEVVERHKEAAALYEMVGSGPSVSFGVRDC